MLRGIGFPTNTKLNTSYPRHNRELPGPCYKTDDTTLVRFQSYYSVTTASFKKASFLKGHIWLSLSGFKFFSPPNRGSFQHSLKVLNTLSVLRCIQDQVLMPPKFKRNIQCILLKNKNKSSNTHTYGTITLYGATIPSQLQLSTRRLKSSLKHHISTYLTVRDSVCPVSFSLAVTNDIAYCFLFLHLLRCFNSVGSQSSTDQTAKTVQEVPLGNLGIKGCLLLPQAYRSLPRPSQATQAQLSPRQYKQQYFHKKIIILKLINLVK